MKNTIPLFLLHQTLQLALCIWAGSVLLASTKPNPRLPDGTAGFITPENVFPLLQSPIAHGDLRLVCSYWKPISWGSRGTVIVLSLLPGAVWKSVVSVATEDRRFLSSTRFSTQLPRSVSLCGLRLRSWAAVAPRRFHLTAVTVDRGSSSRADIWRTDLLVRCHPRTMPRWKSLSSSVRPFYCQCLAMEIAWLCAQFLYTCQQQVWLKYPNPPSINLKVCPHTFGYVVYVHLYVEQTSMPYISI